MTCLGPSYKQGLISFEGSTSYLCYARTRHLNHHLSTPFQELPGFALKMRFQESQRAISILIDEDTHEFNDVLVFQYQVDSFFHPTITTV